MKKILVLEDEENIRSFVVINLKRAGYEAIEAATGEEALQQLKRNSDIKVALLDIMLTGADGYELLDYCKALDVPVIFLTALGEVEDRVRGLRRGAEDYLPKPFALSELLARVETVLRRCGKGEQLLRLEPDIEIDPAARIVRKHGQAVALTSK